ncbi:cupin domain-containing protein [Candidatus Pacearchaeota archaeon]|nr:cupin domain-containing protein [Candidatus Pacearchaeota archaeon]
MNLEIKKLIEYPKKGVLSKVIEKTKKADITLFCMAEGTEISEHTSTRQGIIYVIEGNGIFHLEGKDIKMEEGRLILMKENAVHSLKAEKNTAFLLILN